MISMVSVPTPDENDKSLMEIARSSALSPLAWKVDPLGHTAFQIKHFIIKQGNPTEDTQYRQIIRELWSRWGAYRSNRYEHDKATATIALHRANIEESRSRVCLWGWQRRKRDAEIALWENEIRTLESQLEELQMDLEHRIARETAIFMQELATMKPDEADRMEAEMKNWTARAYTDPKVREIMGEQKLLPRKEK